MKYPVIISLALIFLNVEAAIVPKESSSFDNELSDGDYSDFFNSGKYSIWDAAPDPQIVSEKSGVSRNNSRRLNRVASRGFDTSSALGTFSDLPSELPKLDKNASMCTVDLNSSEDESYFSELPFFPGDPQRNVPSEHGY